MKWVAEQQLAWGLWQEGWALMGDEIDRESMPLWPAKRFAEAARSGDFRDYAPREISLDDLRRIAQSLEDKHRSFAVFPTVDAHAPLVAPRELLHSIDAYIDEWF